MSDWEFRTEKSFSGVVSFDDVIAVSEKFVVQATKDIINDAEIVVLGVGETEEEAIADARQRILEIEKWIVKI